MKKLIKWLLIAIAMFLLVACGGGGSTPSNNTPTAKEIAIDKIANYAHSGGSAPTIADYANAGVTGVNSENILALNTAIEALDSKDADTKDELQNILNNLNVTLPKDVTSPTISLVGENTIIIFQGDTYSDLGVNVSDDRDLVADIDVATESTLNTSILGDYTITYTATDQVGNSTSISRSIQVVEAPDTTKPVVTLQGDASITMLHGSTYVEEGAMASDNKDTNVTVVITGQVNTSLVGDYTLSYSATDEAGNMDMVIRTIHVVLPPDVTAPMVSLNGDNIINIIVGSTFVDPGATANDNRDGDLDVVVSGNVDISTIGEYILTYTATDNAGNETNATRIVKVNENALVHHVSNVTEFRQALEDAAENDSKDIIVLDKGIYSVVADGLGVFSYNDTQTYDLTIKAIEGLTAGDVVLDGNNSSRVFSANNNSSTLLSMQNITIANGYTYELQTRGGGGVYAASNIEIIDCNISNNEGKKGGGVYTTKEIRITNSTFENNVASTDGGGFYVLGKANIVEGVFLNNAAGWSSAGGGFFCFSDVNLSHSTLKDNRAEANGGGFYASGKTYIDHSKIVGNRVDSSYGRGGGFSTSGVVVVSNSEISHNISKYEGGAFYTKNHAIVVNSIFVGNKSSRGGVFFVKQNPGKNRLSYAINSIFAKNTNKISELMSSRGIYINNIFVDNVGIVGRTGTPKFYNNYVDYAMLSSHTIKKNNIQPANVGTVNFEEDNKTLQVNSPVIDKGLNPQDEIFKNLIGNAQYLVFYDENNFGRPVYKKFYDKIVEILSIDLSDAQRINNNIIDMGVIEFVD